MEQLNTIPKVVEAKTTGKKKIRLTAIEDDLLVLLVSIPAIDF